MTFNARRWLHIGTAGVEIWMDELPQGYELQFLAVELRTDADGREWQHTKTFSRMGRTVRPPGLGWEQFKGGNGSVEWRRPNAEAVATAAAIANGDAEGTYRGVVLVPLTHEACALVDEYFSAGLVSICGDVVTLDRAPIGMWPVGLKLQVAQEGSAT
jgi:hypothetical protein